MFFNCSSLISLPDISRWDTCNVTTLDGMLSNCISLISLPNISIWNTDSVIDMLSLISDCLSLPILPDLSIWNNYKEKEINETPNSILINRLNNLTVDYTLFSPIPEDEDNLLNDFHFLDQLGKEKYVRLYN